MSGWRRLYAKPAGSLPGGIVTQWGIGIITVGVLIVMTFYIYLGNGEKEEPFAAGEAPGENVAGSFDNQVAAQVEQEQQRADARRDAAERELLSQQQGNLRGGQVSPNTAAAMAQAGNSPDTGEPYTEEEWELRERLRLEALERRSRSLRSSPVAQTYRKNDGGAFPAAAAPQSGAADDPLAAIRAEGAEALSNVMSTMQGVTANLEDDIAAEAEADQAFLAALRGEAPPADPLATVAPVAAVPPAIPVERDYTDPPRIGAQEDPPGWERIHEGSFLEAALVTQLSGDFPGPVLAVVSVPFYSADRQRVLVPRGSRVIGTAAAVANQDQSRLAVSFHRLILPDGRWVSLEFNGLNQLGEGALKDQVNRHYFSMFAAVGAVGVLSGLTAAGGNPYEGGAAGFRAGAGQGLGQAATRILDRFLNRLPTITIRAGHRLRVWFTSDVLVPRPQQGD